jgi:hypothetical protein
MTVTINGTTGISTPGITNTGTETVTTQVISPIVGSASGSSLSLQSNGTTNATLDTNGNFGLGVTPSTNWSGVSAFQLNTAGSISSTNLYTAMQNGLVATSAGYAWKYLTSTYGLSYLQSNTNGQHQWYTAASGTAGNTATPSQIMTLDASGNLLVGKTSASLTSGNGFMAYPDGTTSSVTSQSTNSWSTWNLFSTTAGVYRFYVGAGGTVYATSTSITALSDQTLKTNIKPLETGLAEINKLQPRRFDWINGDGTNVAGFISQEVQTVLPDLVSESVYSHAEDGSNINKLYLKMGDMIPTMVSAIQQLSAELTTLQSQVTALQPKS